MKPHEPTAEREAEPPVPADGPGVTIGDTRDYAAAVDGKIGAAVERALEPLRKGRRRKPKTERAESHRGTGHMR